MLLETRRLVERGVRWLLRHRLGRGLDLGAEIEFFRPAAAELASHFPGLLVAGERRAFDSTELRLVSEEVPAELAQRVAGFQALSSAFDIAEVADGAGEPVGSVAAVYFLLGDRLELYWVEEQVNALPRANRWQTLARSALRDDLRAHHRAMTAGVLKAAGAELDPSARIDRWVAGVGKKVDWVHNVLSDVRATGHFDLATLSVAVREISTCTR
jgi:glutamate dehydrogenase